MSTLVSPEIIVSGTAFFHTSGEGEHILNVPDVFGGFAHFHTHITFKKKNTLGNPFNMKHLLDGRPFEKIGKQGLSDEVQRGLYGEIYFLRFFLSSVSDKNYCVKSWLGPEKSIQDFQYSNWAVEVKTTHGNNHQKIHITSERQLDDTIIEKIFLYHLSLDVRVGNGESLNILIEDVSELLSHNTMASNLFKLKLLESGYYDIHKPLYDERGYSIRQENLYRVSGNFPRITENQIPIGVGDVRYSIVLSESEEYRINHETLLEDIK